jgi:protein-disulfide isomerase
MIKGKLNWGCLAHAGAVLGTLAGLWLGVSLLAMHVGPWDAGTNDGQSLLLGCGAASTAASTATSTVRATSEAAPCAEALTGRWGSFDAIVGGRYLLVPTAFLGVAYFAVTLLWLVAGAELVRTVRWARRLTIVGLAAGLVVSLVFVGLMASGAAPWCRLCSAVHGVNLWVFACVLIWCQGMARKAETRRETLPTEMQCEPAAGTTPAALLAPRVVWGRLAWVFGLGAVVVVGGWQYFESERALRDQWRTNSVLGATVDGLREEPAVMRAAFLAAPPTEQPLDRNTWEGSGDDTQTRIVCFTDFDCGACACLDGKLRSFLAEALVGSVSVEYRYFAEAAASRAGVAGGVSHAAAADGDSLAAARAAEAARQQATPSQMTVFCELLFARRRASDPPSWSELARHAGLDVDRFEADFQSDAVRERVEADLALGVELGVRRAPAVFVNNRPVPEICLPSAAFWHDVLQDPPALPDQTQVAAKE